MIQTYDEYVKVVSSRLNGLKQLVDKTTSQDQRLDAIAQILLTQTDILRRGLQPFSFEGLAPYSVRTFSLTTARSSPGDEIKVPGNTIIASTNGYLSGCYVRLGNAGNDPISLDSFFSLPPIGFDSFWLETTAQTDKTLTLLIYRGAYSGITSNMQKLGVYLQPELAAKQGIDKLFTAVNTNIASGNSITVTYTPPATKELYINFIGVNNGASAAADRDLNQICAGSLNSGADETQVAAHGGNGGFSIVPTQPWRFSSDTQMKAYATNYSNHNTVLNLSVAGYEISV